MKLWNCLELRLIDLQIGTFDFSKFSIFRGFFGFQPK